VFGKTCLKRRKIDPDEGALPQSQAANWPAAPSIVQAAGSRTLTVEQFQSRYELLGTLGTGSYGKTFSARCTYGGADPSEIVAVKVSFEPETSREPWLLRFCEHPNVVKVIDYFASPYFTLMALKRFDCSLHQYMSRCSGHGGLVPKSAVQINTCVAGALAFVHQQGVIHLDIHAKNILITSRDGDGLVACLADFGMALFLHDAMVLPGFCVHPELHRAPELFFAKGAALKDMRGGDADHGGVVPKYTLEYMPPRSIPRQCYAPALDMWAYGCVMHFIKHRKHVFDGENSYNTGFRPSDRAQLVLDIVSSLGEPAPALVREHSWSIVCGILSFSSRGKRRAAIDVTNVARRCLAYDPRQRMTAMQLFEHCRHQQWRSMEAQAPLPISDVGVDPNFSVLPSSGRSQVVVRP